MPAYQITSLFGLQNTSSYLRIDELSYSLYLWNPLFCYGSPFAVLGRFPLNVLATLVMACASYYAIERPALRLRDRLAQGRAALVTAS